MKDYADSSTFRRPDVLFYLDLAPQIALERLATRNRKEEVFEVAETLQKIHDNYNYIWQNYDFSFKFFRIDASLNQDKILAQCLAKL